MHPDIREKLRVFDLVEKKYWPKGFSHRFWWDNSMIQKLLKNDNRVKNKTPPAQEIIIEVRSSDSLKGV